MPTMPIPITSTKASSSFFGGAGSGGYVAMAYVTLNNVGQIFAEIPRCYNKRFLRFRGRWDNLISTRRSG